MLVNALWFLVLPLVARASVTVYSQLPFGKATSTQPSFANYTAAAEYDASNLKAPGIPSPAPPVHFNIQLPAANTSQNGLSIPLSGSFFGFSIEMSVANQVLGPNSTFLQVPFLNLMSNFVQRAGSVHIRVGGNTQETASIVDSLPNGKIMSKDYLITGNPTKTPTLLITPDLIYMMGNISALVGVKWYLGVPMNDTKHMRLQIAEIGEAVLGENLLGLQVGNEPDLYGRHNEGGRPQSYSVQDYFNEFQVMMTGINNDASIPRKNIIVGPSVSTALWTPEDVFNTGYISAFTNNLGFISVEKYPDDNCLAIYGTAGSAKDPQTEFPLYLDHTAGQKIVQPFLNASAVSLAAGKPFVMFETNTASCGGFPGISDSYGSALWALDYGLQMAYSNFSEALFHVGGQNVYYNPFTPPPTNQSHVHQWTVGPIFYSALAVAEALGNTGTAQIIDLNANGGNIYTPAYAIYEQGAIARVALFNYVTDPSGKSTYTASIAVGNSGGNTPSSVRVKYLAADTVAQKQNITWANQTFGNTFQADGRLQGTLNVETVTCANAVCQIQVPAPGFALVFLTANAFTESNPTNVQTFTTSTLRKTQTVPSIDPSVLATSNGHSGGGRVKMYSTSKGEHESAGVGMKVPSWVATVAVTGGAMLVCRRLWRGH